MNLLLEMQLDIAIKEADDLLNEDLAWSVEHPLEDQLQQAVARFNAAIRALAITNQFKDPATRKKHKSRVMSMLNKLRASLNRLHTAIEGEMEAMQQDSL